MITVNDLDKFNSGKVLSFASMSEVIRKYKEEGKTVGLCHGGYDLLHPGHLIHLESAKKTCDILVVSITSNQFVSSRKGSGRPVIPEELRAYSVAKLEAVDHVVISDFAKGIEVIKGLKPSFYIKGPDFIHKTTPGITAEREAIAEVGGEMKYTNDPKLSTTEIINYVKNELDVKELLLIIDRDGTLIKNDDFVGKEDNWREELEFKDEVISFLSHLQTKYKTTKIIVSNQTGVARKLFDCQRVEEINNRVGLELTTRGVKIESWQYCPDADAAYAELKKNEIDFDFNFVKEATTRKPSTAMVSAGLQELKRSIEEFSEVIVIGNSKDDQGLAENLKVKYIDVNGKGYEDLVRELS